MTWQKVRVTFNDAEGNVVSAVMYALEEYPSAAYLERNHGDVGLCFTWANNDKRVNVEPIRELPTGVGAVIRVKDEWAAPSKVDNIFTLDAEGWWHGGGDSYKPSDLDGWQYEILSEGIQL